MYREYRDVDCRACNGWRRFDLIDLVNIMNDKKGDFKKLFSKYDTWNDSDVSVSFERSCDFLITVSCNLELDRCGINIRMNNALDLAEKYLREAFQSESRTIRIELEVGN